MLPLAERRARFVYAASKLAAEAAGAPVIPAPWDEREEVFKGQFIAAVKKQCGEGRCTLPCELHREWAQSYSNMGWRYGPVYDRENRLHPDLVPYEELGKLERDKDDVFMAMCEIARQWIN